MSSSSTRAEYEPTRNLVVEELRKLCLDVGTRGLVLPGEPKLASQLGVGRATIRDALTRLETEGLILRRKGADTIVNPAAFALSGRIDLQVDFSEILRDCGFEAGIALIADDIAPLPYEVATALEIDAGATALRTRKRWTADGRPVMVAVDWVPLWDKPPPEEPARPVFELAAELAGEEIACEVAFPGAEAVDGEIATELELPGESPVWTLERVGIGRSGRRTFYAFEYHVPSVVRYGFIRSPQRP